MKGKERKRHSQCHSGMGWVWTLSGTGFFRISASKEKRKGVHTNGGMIPGDRKRIKASLYVEGPLKTRAIQTNV